MNFPCPTSMIIYRESKLYEGYLDSVKVINCDTDSSIEQFFTNPLPMEHAQATASTLMILLGLSPIDYTNLIEVELL